MDWSKICFIFCLIAVNCIFDKKCYARGDEQDEWINKIDAIKEANRKHVNAITQSFEKKLEIVLHSLKMDEIKNELGFPIRYNVTQYMSHLAKKSKDSLVSKPKIQPNMQKDQPLDLGIKQFYKRYSAWAFDTYAMVPYEMITKSSNIDWTIIHQALTHDMDIFGAISQFLSFGSSDDRNSYTEEWDLLWTFLKGEWLILTICGILLLGAFILPLVSMCFGCCRCCKCCGRACGGKCKGRCGGQMEATQARKQKKYCGCISAIIVLICITLLVFGACASFLIAKQLESTHENIIDSTNSTFQLSQDFVNSTLSKINQLSHGDLEKTKRELTTILNGAGNSLFTPVHNSIEDNLIALIYDLNYIQERKSSMKSFIKRVDDDRKRLVSTGTEITMSLSNFSKKMHTYKGTCKGEVCATLPDYRAKVNVVDNSTLRPDYSQFTHYIEAINSLDTEDTVKQIKENLKSIPTDIQDNINRHLEKVRDFISRADSSDGRSAVANIIDVLKDTSSSITRWQHIQLPKFDTNSHRIVKYVAFSLIGLGVLVAVIALLAFCGMCGGLCGIKTKNLPEKRSCISHCGGKTLMGSVCLSFLFVWLFCLFGALLVLVFGNITLICDSLGGRKSSTLGIPYGEEYGPLFKEVLNRKDIWDTSIIGKHPAKMIHKDGYAKIQDILKKCQHDNLFHILGIEEHVSIKSAINTDEFRNKIDSKDIEKTAKDSISGVTFVNAQKITMMEELRSLAPKLTHLHTYKDAVIALDIAAIGNSLLKLSNRPSIAQDRWLAKEYRDFGYQLVFVDFELVGQITALVTNLENVGKLMNNATLLIDETLVDAFKQIAEIKNKLQHDFDGSSVTKSANNLINDMIAVVVNFTNTVEQKVSNDIGQCHQIPKMYDVMKDSVCIELLNVGNAVWFTCLIIALFLVLITIAATRLSKYFRRPNSSGVKYFSKNFSEIEPLEEPTDKQKKQKKQKAITKELNEKNKKKVETQQTTVAIQSKQLK